MKFTALFIILALLAYLSHTHCQSPVPQCVKCTPCGEQKGLQRIPMQKIRDEDGDAWAYMEDNIAWTTVLFATSARRNFIQSEKSNPNDIYIIELISIDIGAQPEYYWIDSAQTPMCEIAALEHPRRGYHQFNTMVYRED